ncbi:PREDICTED: protein MICRORCHIDIA 2-like isoform X2 [Camelina sativa]|uniref:Protein MICRORCHIDIA 2-like isoform X2 n=1 Tax=Camelina sativa TaxID=90675 RepID=A0ABM0Z7B5_CAMSA|nr:PREDICTED: protein MICRORCHIDIA 2-like isoform X2 [Camelina sativa]
MQLHISPSMRSITISSSNEFIDLMKIKVAARHISYRTLFHTILILAFLLPFVFILTAVVTLEGVNKCSSIDGNGFKTSTMRLGADAIVFSRSTRGGKSTQSVGLLSYTFLRKTGQDDIIVPMIDIDISKERPEPIIYGSSEDWVANLEILLKWSPFSTEAELWQQFEDIGTHGTKVIIYNLWLNDEGIYELSFDDDDEDIRLRDEGVHDGKRLHHKLLELRSHISYHLRFSLRAYASMLYLKKFNNFKIILRGIPVEQFNIADELRVSEIIKPHTATVEQMEKFERDIRELKFAELMNKHFAASSSCTQYVQLKKRP